MTIKADEIERITDGLLVNGDRNSIIEKISLSTSASNPNYFFIPIKKTTDSQSRIIECVNNGIVGYLIEKTYQNKNEVIKQTKKTNPNIIIIEVSNIKTAYKNIGSYFRARNDKKTVIGITGSVGKTSLKEMLASVISESKNVLKTEENNNILLAHCDAMTMLDDYDIGIIEAGIAGKNIMGEMSKIISPSIAVITNISSAHLESLETEEIVLKEKLKITTYMRNERCVFLNKDDEYLKKVELDKSYDIHWYSIKEAKKIKEKGNQIEFETELYGKTEQFKINTYGLFNISNAICTIRIAELLKINPNKIKKGLNNYNSLKRRLERIDVNGYTIFDDTYNANYLSVKEGLKTIDKMKGFRRKIAVLGDMLELGDKSDEIHMKIGEEFKNLNYDILFTNGNDSKKIYEAAKKYFKDKVIKHYDKKEELTVILKCIISEKDVVYIKASNGMQFNKIVEKLK